MGNLKFLVAKTLKVFLELFGGFYIIFILRRFSENCRKKRENLIYSVTLFYICFTSFVHIEQDGQFELLTFNVNAKNFHDFL